MAIATTPNPKRLRCFIGPPPMTGFFALEEQPNCGDHDTQQVDVETDRIGRISKIGDASACDDEHLFDRAGLSRWAEA